MCLSDAGECEWTERDFGGAGGFVLNDTVDGGHCVVFDERALLKVKTVFSVAGVAGDGLAGGALARDEVE